MSDLNSEFKRIQKEFENLPEGGKIILSKQNSQPVATTQYQWEPSLPHQKTPLKQLNEVVRVENKD